MPLPPAPPPPIPGTQTTALDLIASAMRLIGATASGELPKPYEQADALVILNQMVDSWNAERLMIFSVPRTVLDSTGAPFALVPNQQAYTVGANGNFNIPRPPRIDNLGLIYLGNPAQPLELGLDILTVDEWQTTIPVKNITATIPTKVFDDDGFPFRTLYFWPVPTIISQVAIYSWISVSQFADMKTKYTFPPAYFKALRYCLAVDLAAEMPGNPATLPLVMKIAMEAKAVVKDINAKLPIAGVDAALVFTGHSQYNWLTDEPVGGRH